MRGKSLGAVAALAIIGISGAGTHGAGAYGTSGLNGGFRWDAAPRTIGGRERSLDGGIRYSLQGGSYEAFRDRFSWNTVPSVADFHLTVEQAFDAWREVDPATGLGTALSFVPDFATAPVGTGAGGINTAGAEIDLFGLPDANFWDPGDNGTRAETFFNASGGTVTLTSGTANYAAGAIGGADITINNNPGALYTLDVFRLLLTHEIGHAIGLSDVDVQAGPGGTFIDDNYNGSTTTTALATLTNSWALLVNTLNPAASAGLSVYNVANGDPGIDTFGVNILMESQGLGGQFGDLTPLSNDDFGGRQFLYPQFIPEPSAIAVILVLGVLPLTRRRGGRGFQSTRG